MGQNRKLPSFPSRGSDEPWRINLLLFANSSIQDYVGKSATRAKLQYFLPHEAHSKECFFIFFIKKKRKH